MKWFNRFAAVLSLSLLMIGIYSVMPTETKPQPANAVVSDKYDGDCTGHETAGRCADKCANPTDTLLGFDETTGAAICQAVQTPQPATVTPAQPSEVAECGGK